MSLGKGLELRIFIIYKLFSGFCLVCLYHLMQLLCSLMVLSI